MSAGGFRVWKRVSGPLELEFQLVSSYLMRVWGSELRSHGRAPTMNN